MNKLSKMAVVLGVMGMCICATWADDPATGALVPAATAGDGAVAAKASTWSDMTAILRPSRWAHPIVAGGTLSWLNYNAWSDEPGRTTKVLAGEAIVIGTAWWLIAEVAGGGGGAIIGGGEMPY